MKKNVPIIAVSAVAVCLIAVIGVLGFKASNGAPDVAVESTSQADTSYVYTEPTAYETALNTLATLATEPSSVITQAPASSTTKKPTTTKKADSTSTTKTPQTEPTTSKGELDPDEMSSSSGASVPVTPTPNLPKDMTFAGLYKSGHDVIGLKPYIFNDDKDPECMQKHFGYNPTYDALAGLIDFSIETIRIDFKYENKPYRIQLWKGQYISGDIGTVGGEIGVYTRTPGQVYLGQHYDCAAESDWLKMEMTILWDEDGSGDYKAQFTRNYDDFWWATGFVDGQLADLRDSNPLRLLGRITFESEEQAQLFAAGMEKKGFTKVSTFSPTSPDTFKIYGKDVMFLWQYLR